MITKVEINFPKGLFGYEPGYTGAFTRSSADGAYPNGTRVRKIKVERGDHHKVGEIGTVLGSHSHPSVETIMYFVEWDDLPKTAVACVAWKLERAK